MARKGIRIGATLGIVAALYSLWGGMKGKDAGTAAKNAIILLTGYDTGDGSWNYKRAQAGMALAAGVGVSYLAAKTGVNRYTPTRINI